MPSPQLGGVYGDVLGAAESDQQLRRRLGPEAGETREAVSTVTEQRQPVGYRRRCDARAVDDRVGIPDGIPHTSPLDDPVTDDALPQV